MITLDSADVLGHSVFCDEIRMESTGKLFYIGVYPGNMHVPSFPIVLPRFGISITYLQRPTAFVTPIKFVIFLPGDADDKPSIVAELPEQAARDVIANVQKTISLDPANAFATVQTNFNFAMLPIPKSGLLKVRAVRGDNLFRLGTLLIEAFPASVGTFNANVSQQPSGLSPSASTG